MFSNKLARVFVSYVGLLTVDCCLNCLLGLALVKFAGVLTCFGVDNDVVQEDEDLED